MCLHNQLLLVTERPLRQARSVGVEHSRVRRVESSFGWETTGKSPVLMYRYAVGSCTKVASVNIIEIGDFPTAGDALLWHLLSRSYPIVSQGFVVITFFRYSFFLILSFLFLSIFCHIVISNLVFLSHNDSVCSGRPITSLYDGNGEGILLSPSLTSLGKGSRWQCACMSSAAFFVVVFSSNQIWTRLLFSCRSLRFIDQVSAQIDRFLFLLGLLDSSHQSNRVAFICELTFSGSGKWLDWRPQSEHTFICLRLDWMFFSLRLRFFQNSSHAMHIIVWIYQK